MHAVLPILLPLLEVSIPYNAHNSAPTTSFKEPVEEPCAKSEPCSCLTEDLGNLEKSFAILDVLESFGTHITKEPRFQGRWIGKPKFLGHVINRVRKNEPVELCMPAFPCKSANRENKVLGHLPDLGEELGLSRLNDIAVAIAEVYEPGATVNIASDGILFNDVIGVTDEETWEYGQELRAIIEEKKLDHIVFVHPQTLLGLIPASEMTREKYISTADETRAFLEGKYGSTIKEIEALISADKDTNSTYCGMVKFLETEISGALAGKTYKERKKLQKDTAKKMMQRSEAFTLAIRDLRPTDVRLSMHPSSGAAKLSISLIPSPQGMYQRSPWHSCVAIDADGGYHCVHSEMVKETHDLVYKNGRPYFYMIKEPVQESTPEPAQEACTDLVKEAASFIQSTPNAAVV